MKFSMFRNVLSVAAAALVGLGLSGCGMGTSTPSSVVIGPMQGKAFGGSVPVVGGAVTLWETQTGATANAGGPSTYGSTAKALATTTTDQYGFFNFGANPTYTCSSTEYAYLTVTGGNPGFYPNGVGTNPNLVLMTALGPCSNINSSTSIYVSEVTTTAAAYALANFISEGTSLGAGLQQVYVGAPANNSSTGACTVTAGKTTACSGAGLAHAFTNAYDLVDAVSFNGVAPSGNARTMVPIAFPSTTLNTNSVVPTAMLNRVGNILSACVNSTGGTAGDSSNPVDACNTLFTNATPPVGSAPTDTLMAAVDLAKYPQPNGVAALNGLVSSTPAFLPDFSTAPLNFMIPIVYFGTGGTTAPANFGFNTNTSGNAQQGYVYAAVLDAADNVYVSAGPTSMNSTGAETGGFLFHGMTFNGVGLWNTALDTTLLSPGFLATDTLGNVLATNNANGSTIKLVRFINATTGAVTNAPAGPSNPVGIAVDKFNNIFLAAGTNTVPQITELVAASAYASTAYSLGSSSAQKQGLLSIDANQNIWSVSNGTAGVDFILPNLSITTTSAPGTYSAGSLVTYTEATSSTTNGAEVTGIAIDNAGNAYTSGTKVLYKVTATYNTATPPVITSAATDAGTATTNNQVSMMEVDGSNNLWYANATATGGVTQVANGVRNQFNPCYPVAVSSTQAQCSSQAATPYVTTQYARTLQLDSAGDVWISGGPVAGDVTLRGAVTEIIGTGGPTYPQLSLGMPAVMP